VNLYFACSLTGGRKDQDAYRQIVDHLLAEGHEVPTAHLADAGVMDLERVVVASEIYERDTAWIRACDAMVSEVSTPSHGVGYEIAFALGLGKPVLALYREGVPVSKMITGNDRPGLRAQAYQSIPEALSLLDSFLESVRR
jgi:nucleoside 2-deoxyribosyltransferase